MLQIIQHSKSDQTGLFFFVVSLFLPLLHAEQLFPSNSVITRNFQQRVHAPTTFPSGFTFLPIFFFVLFFFFNSLPFFKQKIVTLFVRINLVRERFNRCASRPLRKQTRERIEMEIDAAEDSISLFTIVLLITKHHCH